MARRSESVWSQLLSLGELMRDGPLGERCRIYQRYFNEENRPDIAPRLWIWSRPSHNRGQDVPSHLVPGLGTRRLKLENFRGLVKIAQIARLQRAYRYLSMCFTSNRGGSHGIYSKSRRCPFVWFLAVPRAVQRGAGGAYARALRRDEN